MHGKASGTVTVGNLLKVAAVRFRDREALVCSATGRRYTYAQLNARTNRLAHALLGLGLEKGQLVGFLATNRAEMVEIYFALAKTGIVGVPLNYRLSQGELLQLMSEFGVRALIFEDRFAAVAEAAAVSTKLAIGAAYEALLASSSELEPPLTATEDDPYYLNLTSGTTGLPKSYVLTQYNNALTVAGFPFLMDLTGDDTVLTVFPMFGRVGFAWAGAAAYVGARNVLTNFDPKTVLGLIEAERVTVSNWVPTMASLVLANADETKHDLSSLRALIFAGAAFPTVVQDRVRQRLCPHVAEYYGMQETGVLTMAKAPAKLRRPESVGQVVPFVELRIVDAEGKDVPAGARGEVLARAPGATAAYWHSEEKSAGTFREGWVHTGDLGVLDEEGFLTLSGRLKDIIISGGQNVFSLEIEALLLSHPQVADCAVIGLPDAIWGEAVTAIVVRAPGATVTEDELIRFCKARLASFKTPRSVIWSGEALPRTATGKLLKYVLVERYRGSERA